MAAGIARDPAPDATLALARDGYLFVARRCARLGSDAFETRLLGRRAVCMLGAEAAEVFYEPGRLTRRGAVPEPVLRLLQDHGSVQTLDGDPHRARKAMFMGLVSGDGARRLSALADEEWLRAIPRWEGAGRVSVEDAAREVLCRATCRWAGVPLAPGEAAGRAADLGAMFDGAGAVGPRHARAVLARRRGERWARGVVSAVREGRLDAPPGSAVRVIAEHRDPDGRPLDRRTAGVELLNILRPAVAVARFVTFAALALQEHPRSRRDLEAGEDGALLDFVQEVRRHYPFFPAIAGRVLRPFRWRGRPFHPGEWLVLDLYGTDHDPRLWDRPGEFRPERFRGRAIGSHELVPQGGGSHHDGHRCPGEDATVALTAGAVRILTRTIDYDVPPQDLRLPMNRFPALPRGGMVIAGVARRAGAPGAG